MHLSVVIPAYNEEKRIEKTLLAVNEYLSKQAYGYEILVVNDGSKDKTAETVLRLASQIPNLKLLNYSENRGKGYVVRQGMLQASGDYRLFMDADNSTTVEQVEGFLPFFKEGYEIVIGSRRIKDAVIAVKQPWTRDFLGGVFRLVVHILVPLRVTDSQAGFKVFSAKAVQAIMSKQTIFGGSFDVEVIAIARKMGFKIKEVPIRWVDSPDSRFGGLKSKIKMLLEILKIRLNLWSNKYK
jgi:dolichyl-phosphate beta-glucosyltransferase